VVCLRGRWGYGKGCSVSMCWNEQCEWGPTVFFCQSIWGERERECVFVDVGVGIGRVWGCEGDGVFASAGYGVVFSLILGVFLRYAANVLVDDWLRCVIVMMKLEVL